MQPPNDPRARRSTIDPTEARQASPRKMNFRVLLASMALAVAVGVVLVASFWQTTPTGMDYSSGGKLGQQSPTPQSPPATPPASAPEAAPGSTNPGGQQTPSTP